MTSDLTCVRCLRPRVNNELDRLLWCEECVAKARRRALWRGWIAGGILAAVLSLYVLLWVRPDPEFIPTVWVALLAAVLYLGARFARELFFGWDRMANREAVEADPAALAGSTDAAG